MSTHYDVIVLGAGLGGLSTATMLAKEGLRVLLLERAGVPGGYATSFVRGRFEFDVSLHELSGIGPPEQRGGLYRYLEYLGVAEKVEFANIPTLYRAVFPSLDVTLPAGRQQFEDKLCATFPKEAKGIRRFLRRVFDLRRDFVRISRDGSAGSLLTLPLRLPSFFRYLPATWGRVLNRDVRDPHARAVISQYWGYFGLPPDEVSFLYMALGLAAFVKQGPSYPIGRSQALACAFQAAAEALGAEVHLNTGVREIKVAGNCVTGVVTDGNDEIEADAVVSNADPITTCRYMIGLDKVPRRFFQQLQSSNVAPSTINVYLGLNCPSGELGFGEHEVFINPDEDLGSHSRTLRGLSPPRAISVTTYNYAYPGISPEGTSIVVLTALYYGNDWCALSPEKYREVKTRIADAMISMAQTVSPNLRSNIETVEVSTPITNMRYAGALGGSIYGFSQPPRDNVVWRMANRGPVEGLYFAGAWTRPGGGYETSIISGRMAALELLKRHKKKKGK